MSAFAVCFAGRMASGKTLATTTLAQRMGWPRVGFGDYVRTVASQRGLDESREVLQDLGQSLIDDLGWEHFCQMVLAQALNWRPGSPILIDGIRHVEALSALKPLVAPSEVRLILIDVDAATQLQRLQDRSPGDVDRLPKFEVHGTEQQLFDQLPAVADLIVDGRIPEKEVLREITKWVDEL